MIIVFPSEEPWCSLRDWVKPHQQFLTDCTTPTRNLLVKLIYILSVCGGGSDFSLMIGTIQFYRKIGSKAPPF
ncbi:MAG: hypothetical protein EBV05_00680 [Cyanobacteria bacterium WB6_1B_304]|nr:hypothetical protein [Cyanobacteria bacterium WB6_1B_304]